MTYKCHRYPNLPCHIYQCTLSRPGDLFHGRAIYLVAPNKRIAGAQFIQKVGYKAADERNVLLLEDCGIDSCSQAKVKHDLFRRCIIERQPNPKKTTNKQHNDSVFLKEEARGREGYELDPVEDYGWAGQTE